MTHKEFQNYRTAVELALHTCTCPHHGLADKLPQYELNDFELAILIGYLSTSIFGALFEAPVEMVLGESMLEQSLKNNSTRIAFFACLLTGHPAIEVPENFPCTKKNLWEAWVDGAGQAEVSDKLMVFILQVIPQAVAAEESCEEDTSHLN